MSNPGALSPFCASLAPAAGKESRHGGKAIRQIHRHLPERYLAMLASLGGILYASTSLAKFQLLLEKA